MLSFRDFLESKAEDSKNVLQRWTVLEPRPIPLQPKPHGHYGTSLDEDTIRITGSREFIESVLARLKDLLAFENRDIKLDVDFRPTRYQHAGSGIPNYEFKFSAVYRDATKKIPMGPKLAPLSQ